MRMKLALVGDDTGHNFTFTSPQPVALNEREKFKTELTTIIGRNKGAPDSAPRLPVSALTHSTPTPVANASPPRAASVSSSENRATPILTGSDPAQDFRLRKTILLGNPELGTLHRELVIGGQITEAEFWEGREVCSSRGFRRLL